MSLTGWSKKLWDYEKICSVLSQWYHSWSNVLRVNLTKPCQENQWADITVGFLWCKTDCYSSQHCSEYAFNAEKLQTWINMYTMAPKPLRSFLGMWIWTYICNSSIFLGVLYFLYYLWWTSEIHPPLRMRISTTSTLGHLQWPEAYYFMMKFSLPWDNSGYNVSIHHEKSSISEPIKI